MIEKDILRKLQLIVFDLDGTLVDDNNEIGIESRKLVKELSALGVKFSIATGRLLSAVTEHADALGIDTPLITLDGSLIQNRKWDKSVFVSPLPQKYVKRALKLADQNLLKVALCHDRAIYYTEENYLLSSVMDKFGAKFRQVASYDNYLENTLEVIVAGDYMQNVKNVSSKMSFPHTFGVRTAFYKANSQGGFYYLEIRKIGCSKGDGLKRLLNHLHIRMKRTAVVGDWYNDKSLFENDSIKVAMANAVPELKRMADLVLKKTNNEDGAADFLKMVLDAKKEHA
jgi:Cof subfamily protein (haloacid dehalogenase superfamily)